MTELRIHKADPVLRGDIVLDGSKSISNRALIVMAQTGQAAEGYLHHLSNSKDTRTLQQLLQQNGDHFDAGDAGTTFRFLTAYLSTRPGEQVLTGSHRMLERPVGPLVDALRHLGARIDYLGQEGYPPLRIGEMRQVNNSVKVPAHVSSQFLSALLLIAPGLPQGLVLTPDGPLVSRPYLQMTLGLMQHFGAKVDWEGDNIVVQPGAYTPSTLHVEADWSAASYWYAMGAFADELELRLHGLSARSWQGDAVLADFMTRFGVRSTFSDNTVLLEKTGEAPRPFFEKNFIECPDIAQTLAVVCAGLGVNGLFSGLETLSIKETDRIAAIKAELAKTGAFFVRLPARLTGKKTDVTYYNLTGKADLSALPRFATYGDHRMAMAFAAFGMLGPVLIEHPEVVVKSYPQFWDHLRAAGFDVTQSAAENGSPAL